MLLKLEARFGPLAKCRAVNYWRGLSTNMLEPDDVRRAA